MIEIKDRKLYRNKTQRKINMKFSTVYHCFIIIISLLTASIVGVGRWHNGKRNRQSSPGWSVVGGFQKFCHCHVSQHFDVIWRAFVLYKCINIKKRIFIVIRILTLSFYAQLVKKINFTTALKRHIWHLQVVKKDGK